MKSLLDQRFEGDKCQDCNGSGTSAVSVGGLFSIQTECPTCYGHGVTNIKNACTDCHGKKIVHVKLQLAEGSVGIPTRCEHCDGSGFEPTTSEMIIDANLTDVDTPILGTRE